MITFDTLAMRKRSTGSVGSNVPATRTPKPEACTKSPSMITATTPSVAVDEQVVADDLVEPGPSGRMRAAWSVVVVDVGVDVVRCRGSGIEPAEVSGRGTSARGRVTVHESVVVVLASARSRATSDGSGGTAARGAHDAQQRIPTVTTARRRGLTHP